MSLSAEYCNDKTGDRGGGGGALAHQRKMIRGLLVWATLLTLGLATSITLHFIHRETPAPDKLQDPRNPSQQTKVMDMNLMTFTPLGEERHSVALLEWITLKNDFIELQQKTNLRVKNDGLYFLYLQVTLDPLMTQNYTITVKASQQIILNGLINKSKLSTGFMGVGTPLNKGETFIVTCEPPAKISISPTETFMGVIKL